MRFVKEGVGGGKDAAMVADAAEGVVEGVEEANGFVMELVGEA